MFSGNIRSNIDPFNEFSNFEIIDVLKKSNILNDLRAPKEILYSKVQKLL